MNDLNKKIKNFSCIIIGAIIFGFGFMTISEVNAQETAMKMVFGNRSIAMPLPKDRMVVQSNHSYIDTVTRIKATLESKDLLIISNVDHQELVKLVGLKTGGMLGIEFFHPRYGKVIAKNDGAAALEMPFRVLVMEANDGKVLITYYRPSSALAPYKGLGGLGRELDSVMDDVVASISK